MKCKHYKGTGTDYKLESETLSLCDKCEHKLMKEMFKQITIERYATLLERLK